MLELTIQEQTATMWIPVARSAFWEVRSPAALKQLMSKIISQIGVCIVQVPIYITLCRCHNKTTVVTKTLVKSICLGA